jgi:hypothetical protein
MLITPVSPMDDIITPTTTPEKNLIITKIPSQFISTIVSQPRSMSTVVLFIYNITPVSIPTYQYQHILQWTSLGGAWRSRVL